MTPYKQKTMFPEYRLGKERAVIYRDYAQTLILVNLTLVNLFI